MELTYNTSQNQVISRTKQVVWYDQIMSFIIPLSLYFCFTNYTYISAIGALSILLLPFLATREQNYSLQETPRKILISLSTFFIITLFSVLITHPSQLISFDFYRRDGNVYISYAALIALICSAINFDIWKILKRFVYISTIMNLVGIAYFYVAYPYPEYSMFFTAHNAAGGFLGMLCICNFALLCKSKIKWLLVLCFLINIFGLYLTGSRGSILPLVGAFVYLFFLRKTKLKSMDLFINITAIFVLFVFVLYVVAVRGSDILVNMDLYYTPEPFEGGLVDKVLSTMGRGGNIINRLFYLYPRAIYMFSLSPIFGAGMGTFNDIDYSFVGVDNFISLNISSVVENNSSHAHNSFFHIMAENGLVGLFIIVYFIWYIRKYSKEIKDKNLSNLIFLMLNFAILSSYTEHRLFTPAEMLPFVYVLGMIISKENYNKKYQSNDLEYDSSVVYSNEFGIERSAS